MATNLVEASKLSNDVLLVGVIEEIIKDSPILQNLPFIDIVGNGLTFNRELALPTIDFYDVGDTWVESTPTFTQITASLKIMGGDADVDNFLKATRSNLQDLEAAVLQLKAKALRHKFEEMFLYGDSATNPKQFDGLRKMIDLTTASDQLISIGTAGGAALTLAKLDEVIDAVKGGKPDALIMSKRSRRLIQDITRAAGFELENDKDNFGNFLTIYNGIPFWLTDWQLDTHLTTGSGVDNVESATTGGDESVIYAVRLGEGALAGLQSPGGIVVEPIGSLETKDATRTRVKWYPSLALFCSVSVAALIGFDAT